MTGTIFRDEYGQSHTIIPEKPLGRGGQGVVYPTARRDVALKLATDKDGEPERDPGKIARLQERLAHIRRLPVPPDCRLARPAAVLRDYCGYVMPLLEDMRNLGALWPASGAAGEEVFTQYAAGGGVRRRLDLLGRAAIVLARLHGAGLVYGDVSPANIFVSASPEHHETWFIDADNLAFQSGAAGGPRVYTPQYGAPELVSGRSPCTPDSDAYSFAVAAFYLLSLNHPFLGKQAEGGWDAEDAWDADSSPAAPAAPADGEQRAYAGELPYVADPADDSNRTGHGFPVGMFATPALAALFEKTFSQAGRERPASRPPSFLWPRALFQAADETVRCRHCGMSWQYAWDGWDAGACPFCGKPVGPVVELEVRAFGDLGRDALEKGGGGLGRSLLERWGEEPAVWRFRRELFGGGGGGIPVAVPARILRSFLNGRAEETGPALEAAVEARRLLLRASREGPGLWIARPDDPAGGGFRALAGEARLPMPAEERPLLIAAFDDERRDHCRIARLWTH